ncbi:MAG: hypothetical protein KDD64_10790 [Bdellovibrionales bacterium]|nr:hypothetical protein [Bdellovibrionales bacterium]
MAVPAEQVKNILENPLARLGISREGIRGLAPEGVLSLAKVFFDYHTRRLRPDLGKFTDAERQEWNEINSAWKELRDEDGLRAAIKNYPSLAPEKEASIAERLAQSSVTELERAREAAMSFLEPKNPIWEMGPCDLVVLDLRQVFSMLPGEEIQALSDASHGKLDNLFRFVRQLPMSADGVIDFGDEQRPAKATLRFLAQKDDPRDLIIRLRRAGLSLPDLGRLLPSSADQGEEVGEPQQPHCPYNLDYITSQQFSEFGLYASPDAHLTENGQLSLLVTVGTSPSTGEPIYHIEGLLLGTKTH